MGYLVHSVPNTSLGMYQFLYQNIMQIYGQVQSTNKLTKSSCLYIKLLLTSCSAFILILSHTVQSVQNNQYLEGCYPSKNAVCLFFSEVYDCQSHAQFRTCSTYRKVSGTESFAHESVGDLSSVSTMPLLLVILLNDCIINNTV